MKIRNSFTARVFAIILAMAIINQTIYPTIVYGLTSGPKSPEFSVFNPVASTDMVNLATGDFKYNIPVLEVPGPDGGGYALSLSYNSGINSEMEASWVGLGWTLNPGAINRDSRGIPDDYSGSRIAKYNKARPNWSVSATQIVGLGEIFGVDASLNASNCLRFNNFKGYQKSIGFGISSKGIGFNLNVDDETGITFSPQVDILNILNKKFNIINLAWAKTIELGGSKKDGGKPGIELTLKLDLTPDLDAMVMGSSYGLYTFAESNHSTSFHRYEGFSWNLDASVQANPSILPAGGQAGVLSNFNFQFNDFYFENNAYGYYNSGKASGVSNVLMDYYVEKEGSYNKRDLFIGMPFINYDNFNVTGEGLNGGFRAIQKKIGHLRPNTGKSEMKLRALGVEVMLGLNLGMGLDLGFGKKKTTLEEWGHVEDYGSSVHFRFNNDMGGQVDYCNGDTKPIRGRIGMKGLPGTQSGSVTDAIDKGGIGEIQGNNPRASYIKEWSLSDFGENDPFRDNLPSGLPEDALVRFSITNESGITYTYGQPVFIRNESNLSIDIDKSLNLIRDNYFAFKELPLIKHEGKYVVKGEELVGDNLKMVIGEVKSDEYAVIYLLTSITGADYIDVDMNNIASGEDFGSWTRFNYKREYGGDGTWYRFRTPYTGFFYNRGMLSDNQDDVGSVYTGEKEVYYLESIETKSHIAWFVTNQYENNSEYNFEDGIDKEREDGLSAPLLTGAGDPAANSESVDKSSLKRLRYLDRIELFSKSRPEKALKTVCFGYDYSLVKNIPNSSTGNGKLTLRKLWFQYEGKDPIRISPYEFAYSYESSNYFETGKEYFEETDQYSSYAQNPDYGPNLIDPWGYAMPYARERKGLDIPYIYQGNIPAVKVSGNPYDWRSKISSSELDFDPASWNLKQIKLPSGGEIHVQYEQKDYCYVQDRDVMAMVSILPDDNTSTSSFHLNLEDLGIDAANLEEVEKQVDKINEIYAATKIYFRFLYAIGSGSADLGNGQSEYIDGYAMFDNAYYEENDGSYAIVISLKDKLPKEACLDFFKANRQGMVVENGSQPPYIAMYEPELMKKINTMQDDTPDNTGTVGENKPVAIRKVALSAMADISIDKFLPLASAKKLIDDAKDFLHEKVCNTLNPSLSYFRVPMIKAKRGGGEQGQADTFI